MKALLYKIGAVLAILFLTLSGAAYAQSITQETDGSWVLSNAAGSDIIILADYGDFTIELGSDESFTYDGKPKKVTSFIITYSEDNEIKQVTDYSIEEDETGEVGHDILYIDNNGGGTAEFWLTYSNNVNIGDNAQVTITNPDGKIIAELKFSIKQAPTLTEVPEVADLTYNGGEQSLFQSAGTATGGTLYYRIVDIDDDFSADLPKAIYAGTYTVEYFVKGSGSYGDSKSYTVDVTINPKELTAPKFDYCDFSKGQNLPVDMEDYEEYLIYFDDAVAYDDVYATIVDVKFPEVEEGKTEEAGECVVTVTLKLEGEAANNYTLPDAIKKDGDIYADFADVPGEILKTCTVTFDNNGHGKAPAPLVVPVDTELYTDDFDPDMDDDGDYEFVGWFYGDDAVNTYEVLCVNEDITITAHWRKKISPGEIAALIKTEKVYDGTTKVDGVVYPQGSPIILKYKGIDLEFSYISYEDPNVGTRKIIAKAATTEYIVNGNQYILPTGEFTVTEQGKITQAPCTKTPDVYAVTESANNAKDGKIVGVDQTMEYRKKDGPVDGDGKPIYTKITTVGSYTDPITSETLPSLDGLAPDTYYVRYAETQNYKPSDDVTVIIEKYTGYFLLNLPDHFEFVTENNNNGNFAMGKKVTFRVSEGYVLVSSEVTTDVTGLQVSKSGVNYSIDMPGRSVEVKATAKADAQFEVSLQGWTYDYEEHIPTIKQTAGVEFTEEQLASIQYYYKYVDEEESEYSTYQPIAAGDYDILAVLEETNETVGASATAKFSISPIVISLSDIKVKGTPSKFYDGNQDVTNLSDLSATINSEILAGDDKLTVKITAGKYPSPDRGKYDNVMLSITLAGDEYVVGNYALEYEAIAVNGEIERKYTISPW